MEIESSRIVRASSRIAWIDTARGIAIVLVVAGHAIHMVARSGAATLPPWLHHLDRIIYTFHVPVFFFLAGLFLPQACQRSDRATLLRHRARALLYPYLIWATVQTTLVAFAAGTSLPLTLLAYARLLIFPPDHFWFVYVLFGCTALLAYLPGIALRDARRRWLPLCVGLGLYALHPYLPGGPLRDLSRSLIMVVAGSLGATWLVHRPRAASLGIVALGLAFLPAAALATRGTATPLPALALMLALGGVAATVLVSRLIHGAPARLLGYLGRHSLCIYLLHVIAIQTGLLLQTWLLPELDGRLVVACSLVTGLLLPLGARALLQRCRLDRLAGLA